MSRMGRMLAVRPGEGRLVGLVALAFAAVEAGRGMGEVGAYTLVSTGPGPDVLPVLFIALGITGLVSTLTYGALLGRVPRQRLFPALLAVLAVLLFAERLLALSGAPVVILVVWVTVLAVGTLLTTALWTVAGSVFHARQAKRLFPLCTSAAIAGNFVGLLVAGPVATVLGSETLIAGEAVLVLVAGGALLGLAPRLRQPARTGAMPSVAAALRDGAAYVLRSPLMRLVAIAYLLFAVLATSVDVPFQRAMREAFPAKADFATALGTLSAAITGTSFLVSTLVANRLYARLGVATVALLLPAVYLGGFSVWLVAFGITSAMGFRFAQAVSQRGLSNAAWSAFFTVVPATRRGQVLAFMDGVPGQLGTVISGVLLLIAAQLGPQQVFVLGALAAALCLFVVVRIRRGYAASLVATLRGGLAEQVLEGGPGLTALTRSPGVVSDLRVALGSERAGERRLAVELLGRIGTPDVALQLAPLLDDPDRSVRLATLNALATNGPTASGAQDAVIGRLADPDGEVRAEAVRAAIALDGRGDPSWLDPGRDGALARDPDVRVQREVAIAWCRADRADDGRALIETLLSAPDPRSRIAGLEAVARIGGSAPITPIEAALDDPEPDVRAAAVTALGALDPTDSRDDGLVAALADPAPPVRDAAARAIRPRSPVPAGVLRVLATGSEPAQDAALEAIDTEDIAAHDELVTWSIGQVGRATHLRRQVVLLEAAVAAEEVGDDHAVAAASTAYLAFLLRRRSMGIELRLLRALSILGATEASGLIRRCLHAEDAETRAQAIEALDALGDSRISRAVVRLLDSEPEGADGPAPDVMGVARGLLDDRDAWVRALAIRTLGAHLAVEGRAVAATALADPEPIVRSSLAGVLPVEVPVPETRATLDELERMLFLRGVPLFSMLAPEDLQRLAMTATERRYEAGEALVVEGDLGDELIVIVEGSVEVVKDEDGTRRFLRRYATGDHIGELAVLREGTRIATVIADPPGVRGLVLGGAAVKAILRERPEAAMSMLGTLADRLSAM